jgi:hypothetical protein
MSLKISNFLYENITLSHPNQRLIYTGEIVGLNYKTKPKDWAVYYPIGKKEKTKIIQQNPTYG